MCAALAARAWTTPCPQVRTRAQPAAWFATLTALKVYADASLGWPHVRCKPRRCAGQHRFASQGWSCFTGRGSGGGIARHPSLPPKCQSSSHLSARADDSLGGAQEAPQIQAGEQPSREAVAARWQRWVAVRDAPCPGHPWRYSREQVGALFSPLPVLNPRPCPGNPWRCSREQVGAPSA